MVSTVEREGFHIRRIEFMAPDERTIRFVFRHGKAEQSQKATLIARSLLATVGAVLMIIAVLDRIDSQERTIQSLTAELQRVKPQAQSAQRLRQDLMQLERQLKLLPAKKNERPTIAAIDELARILPDDTWIFDLEIKGNTVRLQGYSAAASSLIARLDGTHFFINSSFLSPVTQESKSNLERFALKFELTGRNGS